MPILSLVFEQEVNVSAQVGDSVYYILPNANGEFDWANISNIVNISIKFLNFTNRKKLKIDINNLPVI